MKIQRRNLVLDFCDGESFRRKTIGQLISRVAENKKRSVGRNATAALRNHISPPGMDGWMDDSIWEPLCIQETRDEGRVFIKRVERKRRSVEAGSFHR
jgi:hypothetical protein